VHLHLRNEITLFPPCNQHWLFLTLSTWLLLQPSITRNNSLTSYNYKLLVIISLFNQLSYIDRLWARSCKLVLCSRFSRFSRSVECKNQPPYLLEFSGKFVASQLRQLRQPTHKLPTRLRNNLRKNSTFLIGLQDPIFQETRFLKLGSYISQRAKNKLNLSLSLEKSLNLIPTTLDIYTTISSRKSVQWIIRLLWKPSQELKTTNLGQFMY